MSKLLKNKYLSFPIYTGSKKNIEIITDKRHILKYQQH